MGGVLAFAKVIPWAYARLVIIYQQLKPDVALKLS